MTPFNFLAETKHPGPPRMIGKGIPMFFKFMIAGFSEKLSLPPAFLKHLHGEKNEKVILKSSLGKSWQVKFCGGKEGLWFEDGWFDFVQDHDLQFGDCLLFCFDGGMVFHVTIFDTSCCEKKLPLGNKNDGIHVKQESKEDQLPKCVGGLNSSLALKKDKGKRKEAVRGGKLNFEVIKKQKNHGEESGKFCRRYGKSMAKVEIHPSDNGINPHFASTILPSNLHFTKPYLMLPAKLRKVKNISQLDKTILTDPCGRSWPVKVTHRTRGSVYFSRGWTAFQMANALKVGDRCIFELTDARMSTVNVKIIRKPS